MPMKVGRIGGKCEKLGDGPTRVEIKKPDTTASGFSYVLAQITQQGIRSSYRTQAFAR